MTQPARAAGRGFTLIELMVTLSILAIMMTVAAPSFTSFKRNSELTSAANTFVAMLGTARSEAMKRSVITVALPTDGSNWANGWIVFVDNNFNGTYEASTDILITQSQDALPSYLSMTKNGTAGFFKYNGSGYSLTSSGFGMSTIEIARNDLTGAELLAQTRRIKASATGRVRVCTPKIATDPNCSASSAD